MLYTFGKKAGVYATGTLFGLLVIAIGLVWLLGTESALRWGARQAELLSDGRLTLSAVHGSLYGPLRIEALSFQTDEKRFELKELNFDWKPLLLFKRHIQLSRFSLQELRIIETKLNTEPTKLPETLHLPVTFSAPAITLGLIVFKSRDTEQLLTGVNLSVVKLAHRYKLDLRNIATGWGKGQAEMVLGDSRPFSVLAHISLQLTKGTDCRIEADASGNLALLLLKAKVNALAGQADIRAKLMPFEEFPLVEAHLKANGMNPALFRKDLPEADLSAVVSVVRQGKNSLEGNLMVRNFQPGAWDQSCLPLREMTAQFKGTPDRFDLHSIHLDLAGAGNFKGDGQVRDKHLRLNLTTADFNPRGAHGKMRPMQLAGGLCLQADQTSQQLTADLRYQRYLFHLDVCHQDATVELRDAALQSGTGSLALHGTLALEGSKQFQLAGALQEFNPADFGDYSAARVNALFSGTGCFEAEPQATLGFIIADSYFRHQPLSGRGNLSLSAMRIWNSKLRLQLGGNRMEAKGALGNPGDRLSFQIEADDLGMFDWKLGGQVHVKGILEGRFAALSGNFEAKLTNLSWGKDYRIAGLQAGGHLNKGLDGQLSLVATLRGLTTPRLHFSQASLDVQGSRTNHTLQLQVKNPDFDAVSRFVGGWKDKSGWSGQILNLVDRGRYGLTLTSPAKLEVARQYFLLRDAHFNVVGADFFLHELAYNAGQISSRGESRGMPLSSVRGFAAADSGLETDLTLGGNWQFTIRNNVNGHIALWREHGDVSFSHNLQPHFGLNLLVLNMDVENNQLQCRLEAAGTNMGSLKAKVQSMLSVRDGVWGIAGDAPVQGNIDLAIESLAWIKPLLDKTGSLTFDGSMRALVQAGGTFAQPKLTGTLSGDRFIVALQNQGMRFTDGCFQAELQDQVLQLKDLTVRGGDGNLKGQGRLVFEGGFPTMQLSLKADKLELLSSPDRHLVLSGTTDVSAAEKEITVTAKLKADKGLIELPKGDTPMPSEDVVVLGRTKTVDKKKSPYDLDFNLDLDLGEKFFVKGRGLDAQLGGALMLKGENSGLPSSSGSIHVVKGSYSAYGQRLEIEHGILNFQGPLDNPGLDIIAWRKDQPVEAGVAITGTAQSPRVSLVSNPSVPDSEKLSWLVVGHGIGDSSGQEFSALQAAAGVLLAAGQSVTLQQKIAHAAGLEDVSLKGTGGLENTVLTLGKRLSSRAYLSYEQGLTGVGPLVKINYTLTKRLSVRAQAGIAPAVDFFYTFSFD